MTTLFLRHPARAEADSTQCQFALLADAGTLLQQGAGALGGMKDLVESCRKVVLLLAASDVTLLRVAVPPLSAARLKAALPGLVEDQILGDPADCVLVAEAAQGVDGMRTIAVVQRSWLEPIVKSLLAQGARSVSALPAQLCLPVQPGNAAAAVSAGEITVRRSLHEGMGLAMSGEPATVLHTLHALVPDMPLTVSVPPAQLDAYRHAAGGMQPPVTVEADQWHGWIAGAKTTGLDLAAGLGTAGARARDWQRWRWPLRLALLALVVNLAGINISWLRLKREADSVRQAMLQTFKATFPKETVVLDPVAQMRKNLAQAKVSGGQVANDESTAMSAALGEAARALGGKPFVASVEYRDRVLTVKLKPDALDPAALAQVKATLAQRGLAATDAAPGVWQIRSNGGKA